MNKSGLQLKIGSTNLPSLSSLTTTIPALLAFNQAAILVDDHPKAGMGISLASVSTCTHCGHTTKGAAIKAHSNLSKPLYVDNKNSTTTLLFPKQGEWSNMSLGRAWVRSKHAC